jgi:F-type H+-transporting ATPase subunit b
MLQLRLDDATLQALTAAGQGRDAPSIILVQEYGTGEPEGTAGADAATDTEATGTEATAETHSETAAGDHGGAEEKGGMPQLNPVDFPPQLIWLAISFILLLFLMWKVALPRVGSIVEEREKRIQADLEKADRVKADADKARTAYEKTLADARAKAQAELAAATQAIQAETGKRDAAFMSQLNQRTKAAEDSIATAKTKAMGDVRSVAAEVAAAVIGKMAGAEANASEVAGAVDAVAGRRA